jgi:threonine synthase
VLVKCEYEHPTGSFKDRGAAAMVGLARALGVRSAVIDSSGNAGLAVAAACATAGIDLKVFLPAGTDRSKVEAISGFGATVVEVAGPREAAAGAARHEVGEDPGAPGHDETFPWYASHVHQPAFHHGVKTLAYELFEQMGEDLEGATIVAPAGNGTLVLGLWIGTGELVALGRLARRPRLVAVQAERCAPIASLPVTGLPTMASGIAIASPPRLGQIRGAVAATGGRVVTVTEESVSRAVSELLDMGIPVQPTGAVGWAAATSSTVAATGPVVVLATGGAAPH